MASVKRLKEFFASFFILLDGLEPANIAFVNAEGVLLRETADSKP